MSPAGTLVLGLLALTLGLIALALDQADIKYATLVYVFGGLAGVSGAAFLAAVFGLWKSELWTGITGLRQYLWIVGGPISFGLLLGGMEWLISASLYNALGIGAAAYILAQLGFAVWERRLAQRLKAEKDAFLADLLANIRPSGTRGRGVLTVDYKNPPAAIKRLGEQVEQLKAQRDWQIRVRCRKLADGLDKLLKGWERDEPKNREAMREYRNSFKAEATRVINDLKEYDLWKSKVDYPEYLENPENRKDVQDLADYLRWVALGFPK